MRHSQNPSIVEKTKDGVKKGFILRDYYNENQHLSVILDSTQPNQSVYYAFMNASKFLQNNGTTGISFYIDEITNPIFYPQTAIFSTNDLQNLDTPVIATSLRTLNLALAWACKKIHFYIYDIHELFFIDKEKLSQIHGLSGTIFTRNKDYKDVLERHFSLKVSNIMVPDFNFEKMIKVF